MTGRFEIDHNEPACRFELVEAPDSAYLEYRRVGNELTVTHTVVRGERDEGAISDALLRRAMTFATNEDLTVLAECRTATSWLEAHPEAAAEVHLGHEGNA